jgi:hypothetical protein
MRSTPLAAPSFDTGNRFVNDNRPMPRLHLVSRDEKPRLENFLPKHHLLPSANNTQAQVAPRKITVIYDRSASGQTIYANVGGNPLTNVDPYGLEIFPDYVPGPMQPGDIWSSQIPNYPNAQVYNSNGRQFLAPQGTDWCAIQAAGQANGLDPFAANQNVGQYGTYDFQRIGGKHPEYIDASNYGVGVYMNGAGYWQWLMNLGGSAYSFFKSSNANSPKQSLWWNNGWNDANNGTSNCSCSTQAQ